MPGPVHKISVLATRQILLNGAPATIDDIVETLDASPAGSVVWYYREHPDQPAPDCAIDVLKAVAARRLQVRLFLKPDFSEADPPHTAAHFARIFEAARARAAQSQLVVVRSDGRYLGFPAVPRESMPKQVLDEVERIVSPATKRNVAVITDTSWAITDRLTLQSASAAIPFMGLLVGLTTIGHAVWVFDSPSAPALESAFTGADLLIIDDTRVPTLPGDWQATARSAMRLPKIYLYKRETRQLLPVPAPSSQG